MPADLRRIGAIAARHRLLLIEDAACAIGSEYRGQRIGAPFATMACFSFHPRKILTTGEGGMITTADADIAARLRKLRQHAMGVSDLVRHSATQIVNETYGEVGFNYRMTDLQAAIGISQLQRLDKLLARRRSLAARYSTLLSAVPWIETPKVPLHCLPNFQSYMVRLRADAPVTRDVLMQRLLDRGISSRRGVMAIHREAPYRSAGWDGRLPLTNAVADSTLILPLFHEMSEADQDYVVESIKAVGR
jgi:dTDP-4-amino-4,6-dideoxygalactose transaminase